MTAQGRFPRKRLRAAALAILAAGLRAADPAALVRRQLRLSKEGLRAADLLLPFPPNGRLILLAAGKAAVPMAAAAEAVLGRHLAQGLAVAPRASLALRRTAVLAAGHPLPDPRGRRAAEQVERLARGLGREDLLLVLLSGGASALLPAPAEGVGLKDKARITALLVRAGATIHELNTVRKHLSRLKGGGLARLAAPARVVALVLSDVVGDDPSTIASGPCSPDATRFSDALGVLARHRLLEAAPPSVRRHLEAGARGERAETPKPKDRLFRRVTTRIIGGNRLSLEAAAREARRQGVAPLILTSSLEGEAREVVKALVAILRECVETGRPAAPPVCLLAGGETTVTVRGTGAGGRNQELVVAAAALLEAFPVPAVVVSLATDGVDGSSDAAGGVADDRSAARARALGLAPPAAFLAASDSRNFLGPLGELIVTGPSGTNVMDLTLLLAGSHRGPVAR